MIICKMVFVFVVGCIVVIKVFVEIFLFVFVMCVFCECVGIFFGVVNVVIMDKGERENVVGFEFCEKWVINFGFWCFDVL